MTYIHIVERIANVIENSRVKQQRGQDARTENVHRAEFTGDVEVSESVKIFVVCAQKGSEDRIANESYGEQAKDLDAVVEPVSTLIEGEVALVSEDGGEAADEHRDVQLHGFEGNSADRFGGPGLVVEQQEAEALEQRGQGLQ